MQYLANSMFQADCIIVLMVNAYYEKLTEMYSVKKELEPKHKEVIDE